MTTEQKQKIEASLARLERIAQRLEASPFGTKCEDCGHASSRHNELAYCLVGQCSCQNGNSINDEALFIRREIEKLKSVSRLRGEL